MVITLTGGLSGLVGRESGGQPSVPLAQLSLKKGASLPS